MRHALVLLTLVASPTLAAEPHQVLLIGGEAFSATLSSAKSDGAMLFMREGKPREVAARDLVAWGAPPEARQEPQVLLADGGLLVADVLDSDEERLLVDVPLMGKLSLPLEQVAGILFHPPLDARRRDELMQRALASTRQDLLILDNGDEVAGTVMAVAAKEVQLKAATGTVKIETDRILAVAFDTSLLEAPQARGLRLVVGFSDGSRLVATSFTAADGKAQLTRPTGQKLYVPLEQIVFLQTLGGRAEYLSDIKPTGYKHVPFLEIPWSFQLDRNVQGGSLRSGGRLYLKGVGMHSASRLTFSLDGRHNRCAAEVALDDQAGPRGSVVFRIFVDAEQKYASPVVRGGDAPLPISVDLPDTAKTLSLIVDFADRGDESDYANWLNARLEQ